MDVIHFGNINL